MDNTPKEKFESLWADFIVLVKGKLITVAKQQKLTTPLANLMLSDAASSWGSGYEINGRWMMEYEKTAPDKAALLKDILLHDMRFTNVDVHNTLPSYCDILVPVVGAGAGLAISYALGAGKIVQAVSALAPAILLFPAVKSFRNSQAQSIKDRAIDEYIGQLDKFYNSAVAVLS